jgi:hypothetical protein
LSSIEVGAWIGLRITRVAEGAVSLIPGGADPGRERSSGWGGPGSGSAVDVGSCPFEWGHILRVLLGPIALRNEQWEKEKRE